MQEPELVDRLRNGDESAYRVFVDTYQSLVLNCCYRFVVDRETAEDLTQEVFIEVHRSIRRFKGESKLSTWVYRIAVAKSLDHLKSQKRKKRWASLKHMFPGGEGEADMLASNLPNPQELLEHEDRRRILAWAIASLPDNQRVAFTLSKFEELSYQEIADVLDATIPAVESLIFRAKVNLKNKLMQHYKQHI